MTCRRLVASAAFMWAAVVVRRRRRPAEVPAGFPVDVVVFEPEKWPGTSEYQRWAAWFEARHQWAADNLPDGSEGLPSWDGVPPDQPWSEVVL